MQVINKLKTWKKKTLTKENVKRSTADFFILLAACCISAFSVVGVMIPNGLTSGGITGIARMLQNYVNVDFSVLYYLLSIVVVVLVAVFLGWKEVKKILLLAVMYPTVLAVFEQFDIQLLEDKDILLAAVFCGVFTGIYVGLIFWRGYASAGTDAIAKILRKKLLPGMSLSKILLIIDAVIIIASALVFSRNIALYALITQVIITKTSEMVLYGFESKIVQLTVITTECEAIRNYIITELDRGATSFEARGEYTGRDMRQIMLLCSPRESILVKRKIAQIDPHAFVTVSRVEAVWGTGRGFSDIDSEN